MTVPKLKITVCLLPEVAWPIIKPNVSNTRRSLVILINYTLLFYSEGSILLCNRIPKGNMKLELNQTQAICSPEGLKPKVCVTTTISSFVRPPAIAHGSFVVCVSRDWLQTTD